MRLKICDSHLTCKVARKCLNVRERVEVVEWNRKRFPPFPCCPVSCQCPWKETLIEKKKKILKQLPAVFIVNLDWLGYCLTVLVTISLNYVYSVSLNSVLKIKIKRVSHSLFHVKYLEKLGSIGNIKKTNGSIRKTGSHGKSN